MRKASKHTVPHYCSHLPHVRSNNVAVVEVLLEAGARVDLKDGDGWTAVHFAAKFNHVDALEKLLAVRAHPC